jgi:hypothetical protein
MSTAEDVKPVGTDVECVEKSSQLGIDAAEEKALVRKIDLYLLPTIWFVTPFQLSNVR